MLPTLLRIVDSAGRGDRRTPLPALIIGVRSAGITDQAEALHVD